MPLSADRIITPGQTPHAHERDAFDFVVRELPDTDPYRLWAFVDLIDSSGRRYDLDLLILGYHALYLVEVKSHVGTLTGDEVDWSVTFPDGGRTTFENPLRTTTHKARVLSSLLDRRFDRDPDAHARGLPRPWVQPLIFLAGANLNVNLTAAGGMHVVTRRNFREAITRGEFPGAPDRLRDRFVNRPAAVATQRLLKDMGLRPSIKALKVQDLILRQLLEDGAHYQDHLGVHQSMPSLSRRVRSFIVPANTTAERREQLVRAAKREAQILTTLSDHRHVLRFFDYTAEGPLGGPCVILEHIEDALPLDVFLRANPGLPFEDRIAIIQQIAEALEFSHRKQVFHRGLSPRAVLVRRANRDSGPIEVRLYNFQLASTEDTSGTVHISSLSAEQTAVYVAPEVLENPAAADAASDVFSLGAIAYHVLTGQPPGTSLAERAALLTTGRLSVAAARDDLAGGQTGRSLENALATPATAEDERARLEGSSLDEVVGFATEVNRHNRADSAIAWLNLVLDAATTPTATSDASFVSPLEAGPGQRLADDLEVVAVLGSGSTARVLRVRRGQSEYALKVAHEPELEDRLHHEARVLRSLEKKDGSGRIVSLVEELTLGDRACLLMTDAGDSLAALIAREGPPSLDFARRWGEDLLSALELLEDNGIQHRDIKPANLGVLPGQAKKKRSLLLFDFSLAGTGDAAITVGTPAYRDPFLDRRGRWDAAADRWAAAMTLHELLTGIRPGWGAGDETAAASEGEIRVAAERFDASGNVRPRLTAFFKKALAREVGARYPSVEAMRIEWVGCFASTDDVAPSSDGQAAARVWDFTAIGAQTPIAALPLSARAKNALDRAGMTTTAELLQMPRNRLSTTRGIGRQTHQEIQRFADAARAALGERLPSTQEGPAAVASAFFGECRDPGSVAQIAGLSPEAASALEDAGLGSLSTAAAAPRAQVERVLQPYAEAVQLLLDHLRTARPPAALVTGVPTTIEDWLDQLFARREKADKYLLTAAQLLGLEPVPGEEKSSESEAPEARDVRGLARRLGVTSPAVYIAFGKAREHWRKHPQIGELSARLARILDRLGTVAPLSWIADELAAELPHRAIAAAVPASSTLSASPAVAATVAAQALVRIAAESSGDDVVSGRIRQRLWIATGQVPLALARALGERADALAGLVPLPSSEEVREALARVIDGTTLVALPHDRLIALAAEASVGAARSARLELYPRGMAARRALELSATAIAPHQATPEAIRQIVRARYPEAEALPEGEALHPLLYDLGFKWEATQGAYIRPGAELLPSAATVMESRWSTTHTNHRASPPSGGGESQEAIEFEARLRMAVEKRSFRVLDVAAGYDNDAAGEIARRFGARVVSLESEMLVEADRLITEDNIEPALVDQADRQGPGDVEDWQYLCKLMQKAATRAVARVLTPDVDVGAGARPVVILQPGMLARYGLEDVLLKLVAQGQRDDAPPIFLVNPTDDGAEWARIDSGTKPLTVPITSQAQRLKVPVPWVTNRHRAGAL